MGAPRRRPPTLITPVDLPRWVPGIVTCTSAGLGWKDIAQRGYRYRGQDVEIPPLDSFMIVRYRHGATPMERRLHGRWTRTHCRPGDFSLLSRSAASHWHWTAGVEVSHLYLSEALMSRVASDMLGREVDEVRLHDVLRGSDLDINRLVDEIAREARNRNAGGPLYVEALGVQLAVQLLRGYASCVCRERTPPGCLSKVQRARLEEYIDAHLQDSITLDDMAALLGMGVWTFGRRVRQTLGCTAHALVMRRRVERAASLLRESGLALKQVAAACGFSDQAHLSRRIKAELGATPGAYREAFRGAS